jgi:hypothetical protein
MPPVELARQFQHEPSHHMDAKGPQDHGSSFEAANPPSALASRDKEFGAPGDFQNIVNGRYSGIGRGGSVGDELVRPARNSCVVPLQGLKYFCDQPTDLVHSYWHYICVTETLQARLRRELHAEQVCTAD